MGTLKDEMREDRLLGEKVEDGEGPGSSDGTAVTDATLKDTVVESTGQDHEPQMDYNKDSVCVQEDATADMETRSISAAVPSTPDPTDPRSPAPFGQQHMRTQVSLEVVQCHSAATSPMTPPEGGHDNSFFFPSSFGRAEAVGTDSKDAELQVGQQVEYSSVATSPMTPKTPFFSTFSLVPSQKKTEDGTKYQPESEASKCPTGSSLKSESKQQQRMGSMDQDITILVTQHGTTEEEGDKDSTESNVQCPTETETEKEEEDVQSDQEKSQSPTKTQEAKSELKSANSLEAQENKDVVPESPAPFGCHNMRTQVSLEVVQCQSVATSPMTPPQGDQAFCFPTVSSACGGVGTETKDAELQVEQQVEYRSVATAPMTPRTPTATTFPDVLKGHSVEEKIVEEEEEKETPQEKCGDDREGEGRGKRGDGGDGGEGGSEGGKEGGAGEGAGDGERGDGSKDGEGGDGGVGEGGGSERKEGDEQTEEEHKQEVNGTEDKCEEPVQEVSWDEKGMTWEVYGAVVEVSVLGTAIQKHLEKQVKKQKKQTLPPPPPLNPSAMPLGPSEVTPRGTGSGRSRGSKRGEKPRRNRRNPFRLMMENMQQPHCCSRAHTTE